MTDNADALQLLDPAELVELLDEPDLRVIDLSPAETFSAHHVPGAVHLPYGEIVAARPPVGGLLPDDDTLLAVLRAAGIGPEQRVVAMDSEGGGAAGRLLWTLDTLGQPAGALLDGGLQAWVREGFPVVEGPGTEDTGTEDTSARPPAGVLPAPVDTPAERPAVTSAETIMQRLGRADFRPLDARSDGEFDGSSVRAARGGHIPGAVHYEWTRAMDHERNLRLRPLATIRDELAELGLEPEHEIVTYCHTHHRSAFSYALLRILGYPRVSGYPGSWSDWGNRDDTPIE